MGAVGAKCGPQGPSEDLSDLQMGHLGPTWVLLGFQKRPDTRPKCVLTIIPAKSDKLATVGTKASPSGALRSFSPSHGLFEAKGALLSPPWVPKWPQGGRT